MNKYSNPNSVVNTLLLFTYTLQLRISKSSYVNKVSILIIYNVFIILKFVCNRLTI